jgi:hypothetical protein
MLLFVRADGNTLEGKGNKLYLGLHYMICDPLERGYDGDLKPNCILMSDGLVIAKKKLPPSTELVVEYAKEKEKKKATVKKEMKVCNAEQRC